MCVCVCVCVLSALTMRPPRLHIYKYNTYIYIFYSGFKSGLRRFNIEKITLLRVRCLNR